MKSSLIAGIFKFISTNRHCVLCQQSSSTLLCRYCIDDLPYLQLDKFANDLLSIPKVRQGLSAPAFDRLFAISDYQWPFSHLIRQLKFRRKIIYANALAEIFCSALDKAEMSQPEAIVPVPLHSNRLINRGYNQSYQIARQVSLKQKIPIIEDTVSRTRATQAQTALSASGRRKNLTGAFSLNKEFALTHIAVFDDVITTGETANEMCKVIKQAYPDIRIDLWAMCISLDRQ